MGDLSGKTCCQLFQVFVSVARFRICFQSLVGLPGTEFQEDGVEKKGISVIFGERKTYCVHHDREEGNTEGVDISSCQESVSGRPCGL